MRNPSPRILTNLCQVYSATQAQDIDGGPQWTYPTMPTLAEQPCSIQAGQVVELVDDQGRVTQYLEYRIMFGVMPQVRPRDKITYVDVNGNTRVLFARTTRDEAGRGAAFVVRAVERI